MIEWKKKRVKKTSKKKRVISMKFLKQFHLVEGRAEKS